MDADSGRTPRDPYEGEAGIQKETGRGEDARDVFRCQACGAAYPAAGTTWRCRCGSPLEWAGREPSFSLEAIRTRPADLWRYAEALPSVPAWARVSLGEGMTPLVEERRGGRSFLLKLDHLMPTGSFKDRGSAVMVSLLRAWGIDAVVEDSSGNAAASLAAYAARAGIDCRILVPESASPAKLVQAQAAGARVVRVPGDRQATARAAEREAVGRYYASHVWNPLFMEGTQTAAFEIWEQLEGRVPAAVVTPVGNGSLLLGLARGFQALRRARVASQVPTLIGVQAKGCAPLARAFARGDERPAPLEPGDQGRTVAEGIAVARPARGTQILRAVRESGGTFLEVDDDGIWQAAEWLARRGCFVEPTGAAAVAGLFQWRAVAGAAWEEGPVVLMVTGSGLKQADAWRGRMGA
ncbi:threonine synthase [Limnochorda pilosa]|uniref:Threonine synthase n=1 Tax=Limnochorda pilosa TaxID=1555112 RepID=A0A0K2SG10_LIMPI|nr:threonine synthase [Limnochorda pilosa]BAS26030.1 threonine synthase [Limnochorda pilosa]